MSLPRMDGMNPYLGIGVLAAVSFALLFVSAFLVFIRDRRRRQNWENLSRDRPVLPPTPSLHEVWHPPPNNALNTGWSSIVPLNGLFVPDKPIPLYPPPPPTIKWSAWRVQPKSKVNIQKELDSLHSGILQVGMLVRMPQIGMCKASEGLDEYMLGAFSHSSVEIYPAKRE